MKLNYASFAAANTESGDSECQRHVRHQLTGDEAVESAFHPADLRPKLADVTLQLGPKLGHLAAQSKGVGFEIRSASHVAPAGRREQLHQHLRRVASPCCFRRGKQPAKLTLCSHVVSSSI